MGRGMSEAILRAVERAVNKNTTKTTELHANTSCAAHRRRPRRIVLMGALAALLTSLSAESASAQVLNWTATSSNDWTVGSNWFGGAVPTDASAVSINSGSVVLGVNGAASGTTSGLLIGGIGS